jgi:hypothetical protein
MQFNNANFQKGVTDTLGSLSKLNSALGFDMTSKLGSGFDNVVSHMGPVGSAVDAIKTKFSVLAGAAAVALGGIAQQAIQTGLQTVKALTIDPIKEGWEQYQDRMQSVMMLQTSLGANAGSAIQGAMQDLNKYAQLTIYNVQDMNSALGQMVSQGINLQDAETAIKGFGNAAAGAGVNTSVFSSELQTALVPALALGKLQGQNWMQLKQSGIATSQFKDALIAAANAQGQNIKTSADFQNALTAGTINTNIMIAALKSLATNKSLLAAATQFHTFREVSSSVSEGVVNDWADFWGSIFGDSYIGQEEMSTEIFTKLGNALMGVLTNMDNGLKAVGTSFRQGGGLAATVDAFAQAWRILGSIITPIKQAFKEVFPTNMGTNLANIAKAVDNFFKSFKMGATETTGLRNTFEGLFSIIDIIGKILGGVIGYFAQAFGLMTQGSGDVIRITGDFGELLNAFDKWLSSSDAIGKFFDIIESSRKNVLAPLLTWIGLIIDAFNQLIHGNVSGFFDGIKSSFSALAPIADSFKAKFQVVTDVLDKVKKSLDNSNGSFHQLAVDVEPVVTWLDKAANAIAGFWASLASKAAGTSMAAVKNTSDGLVTTANIITGVWEAVAHALEAVWKWLQPVYAYLAQVFDWVKGELSKIFGSLTASDYANIGFAGFFAAFLAGAGKFMKDLGSRFTGLTAIPGDFDKLIKGLTESLENFSKALQTQVKANLIESIGIALGILAVSVLLLAQVPADKLANALAVLVGSMLTLITAMSAITKLDPKSSTVKLLAIATAIAIVSTAMVSLAGAVLLFSLVSPDKLANGLIAMAAAMIIVVGALQDLDKSGPSVLAAAGAIQIVASAMLVLAGAVAIFAAIPLNVFLVGLGQMAIALVAVIAAMDGAEGSMAGAAAILIVANAMVVLGAALQIMGAGNNQAKALITMAGALTIMVVALNALADPMVLAGAGAILIMAAAFAVLAPVIGILGVMPWQVLATGLAALAVGLGIFVAAGYAAIGAMPGLLGLSAVLLAFGAAVFLVGAAIALAGTGMMAFAEGIALLSGVGAAGAAAIVALGAAIIGLLPQFGAQLALALQSLVKVLISAAPTFLQGFIVLIDTFTTAITTTAPKIINMIIVLLEDLITAIENYESHMIQAGIIILTGFINGLSQSLPKLVGAVGNLMVNFLNAMTAQIPRVAAAGTNTIIAFINAVGSNAVRLANAAAQALLNFINGMTDAVNRYSGQIRTAGLNLAGAIIDGMTGGLASGVGKVVSAAEKLAGSIPGAIKKLLGIASPSKVMRTLFGWVGVGASMGIDDNASMVSDSATALGQSAIDGVTSALQNVNDQISNNVELSPTISPVLDLTNVKSGADQIGSMLGNQTVKAGFTTDSAQGIAQAKAQQIAQQNADAAGTTPAQETNVTFNQYNNSPKALSDIDIYRQTNNQISKAKGVLVYANTGSSD